MNCICYKQDIIPLQILEIVVKDSKFRYKLLSRNQDVSFTWDESNNVSRTNDK